VQGFGLASLGSDMRGLPKAKRRRKGVISLTYIDRSITAETTQSTIDGAACQNCGSTVRFAYRPGTCVRCHKQWRRDHEKRPKYYYSKASNNAVRISPEQRQDLIESQGWACKICRRIPLRLYLDHCHETGKIRGMLCLNCNSGLGSFADDTGRMVAAIEYLRSC
jgi:predicted Zn-ribbon and HTH transcriptional regulator